MIITHPTAESSPTSPESARGASRGRMARALFAAPFLICLMAALTPPVQAAGSVNGSPALDLEARVDRYLAPYLETGNFSGSILIGRGGEVLLSKAYGLASIELGVENTPQTVYHLASVSRVFTPAAILLLEQQGKLKVSDPLSKYLPDWPRGNEITIHHLLTLSAGFPNINSMPGYAGWQLVPQTPETLVARFRDLPLEFAPGERTVHSNSNYNVLALLIERISGRSFGEFLAAEVLAPLDMKRTGHHGDATAVISGLATGYTPEGRAQLVRAPTIDWSVKTGNGSLFSTTEDLYRFDRALVNRSLLSEASVARTFTEHFPDHGYGWFVRERFGTSEVHINGRSPGFGSYWGRSVGNDVTVIVLGNIYGSAPTPIGRDLIAMALGEAYEGPRFRSQAPDPTIAQAAVGSYQFGSDYYVADALVTVRSQNGHLFDDQGWLMPVAGMRFIHRIYGSELTFVSDETGAVTGLRYDDFLGERVD